MTMSTNDQRRPWIVGVSGACAFASSSAVLTGPGITTETPMTLSFSSSRRASHKATTPAFMAV